MMVHEDYVAPEVGRSFFTCPHCGVRSQQLWRSIRRGLDQMEKAYASGWFVHISICVTCSKICLWRYANLVYPQIGNAPPPNPDIPKEVKKDYEEAANISILSPRGAAALLRLAVQKLCVHLGGKGENINNDISLLVSKGLPDTIQQALDVVRVVGNDAVHPGQIDVDDPEVVAKLFGLLNVITEYMVSMPKKVADLYEGLPESKLDAIKKRDSKV